MIHKSQKLGEIVAADYRTSAVFQSYGLDYCCKGNRSLSEACEASGIDADAVTSELNEVTQVVHSDGVDYANWPLDKLADLIEHRHHRYVEERIPLISAHLDKVCRVHGKQHPELAIVQEIFKSSAGDLAKHMKKEELVLFPLIRKMVKSGEPHSTHPVSEPIRVMMQEHDVEGERFREIERLTNGYNPPADGCNTYRVTFALLKEFQDDLHLHVHLDNNILFPGSIKTARAEHESVPISR